MDLTASAIHEEAPVRRVTFLPVPLTLQPLPIVENVVSVWATMGALLERSPDVRRSLIVARLLRWRDLIRRRSIWILRRGSLRWGLTFCSGQVNPA
ncbi:hypothetical protein Pcac1_g13175 [Phytophthora cactorum]|nr:hypothetical protein Pcac1_g13175 [Phytophthora cactorum]